MRMLIAALLLFNAASAFGAPDAFPSAQAQCRQERPLVRELWQRRLYDAPALAKHVVIAAISGDLADVRQSLDALPRSEVARWRQVAMYTAAEQGQSAVVDALLNDGASVDGSAKIPPLDTGLYRRTVDDLSQQPPFNAKAVKGMQALGIVSNEPQESGPTIFIAIGCNDLATVNVLLHHHAEPMASWPTPHSADPFISAIIFDEPEITRTLLDRGADPCSEDERLLRNAKAMHRPAHTVAEIGKHTGLPVSLLSRLECHASHQ